MPMITAILPNAATLTPIACALVRLVECENPAAAALEVGEGGAVDDKDIVGVLFEPAIAAVLVAASVMGEDDMLGV